MITSSTVPKYTYTISNLQLIGWLLLMCLHERTRSVQPVDSRFVLKASSVPIVEGAAGRQHYCRGRLQAVPVRAIEGVRGVSQRMQGKDTSADHALQNYSRGVGVSNRCGRCNDPPHTDDGGCGIDRVHCQLQVDQFCTATHNGRGGSGGVVVVEEHLLLTLREADGLGNQPHPITGTRKARSFCTCILPSNDQDLPYHTIHTYIHTCI